MSKFFKGDVTNGVVEFNLLDPAVGAGGTTATVVTKNTAANDVEKITGDIPANQYSFGSNGGYTVKGLVIGTSCTSIGSDAFQYCFGLTGSLVIPDSVTSIGSNAFTYCSALTDDLIIPDSVTSIQSFAFYGCGGFTGDLVIPDSVTSIGSGAFRRCSGLTALYTNTPAASWVGTNALVGTTTLVNIYEGPDVIGQYSATFQGGSGMTVLPWTNYPNIP